MLYDPEDLVVFDIETISEAPSFASLSPEWKSLWESKAGRCVLPSEPVEESYASRAAVMAEFARVICISMGYFLRDAQTGRLCFRVTSCYDHDERQLLQTFLQKLELCFQRRKSAMLAGHNIREFDVPFVCRRLLVHGIAIPSYLNFQLMKPWEIKVADSFQLWRFGDYKQFTSLRLLAAVMRVPSPKDDIDGSLVGPLYWGTADDEARIKQLQRISAYCTKDVVATANILLRFIQMPLVGEEDVQIADE
ncbi:MAG TPA: 3'-5' exonuclease [Chitinophagaceae bacterium]|nr:3'-5' exonuclease [Chitinophagaceae bacterium]